MRLCRGSFAQVVPSNLFRKKVDQKMRLRHSNLFRKKVDQKMRLWRGSFAQAFLSEPTASVQEKVVSEQKVFKWLDS